MRGLRKTIGAHRSMPGQSPAVAFAWLLFLIVRGTVLWLFLIPAILPWLLAVVCWPILRPFGFRVPVAFLYYSRWATYLLDGLLTRVAPIHRSSWPWQVDVGNSRITSWGDLFYW